MGFRIRLGWTVFWQSGGAQGKCLREDTKYAHLPLTQIRMVYLQNFSAFFISSSFIYMACSLLTARCSCLDNIIQPYEAFQARARIDHTSLSWFFDDFNTVSAATAAVEQDVAIVFLQSDSGEGYVSVDGNLGDR